MSASRSFARAPAARACRVAAAACALAVAPVVVHAQTTPAASAPPATSGSPLPTIGRTHAKGFCDMVRENAAPSVLGLMKTDELVAASHRAVSKMAQDQIANAPEALQMDRVYMDRVVAAMANNMKVLAKLLSDPSRFPKVARTDDDRLAQLLQAQLRAARDAQNAALNRIGGILETTQEQGGFDDVANAPVAKSIGNPGAPSGWITPNGNNGSGFLGAASLAGPGPIADLRDRARTETTASGHTIWDRLATSIEADQTRIALAEHVLTPTVIAAATGCRGG